MMPTDAELVASALRGSEAAFRELVVRFERPVYALILRMVREPETAEDLAQEVFVKAFRRLSSYDPRRKFASWLFKVAHNATIDHLRRSELETVPLAAEREEGGGLMAVLADTATESPAAAAERRDMARALERAIAGLRPEYREAVLLRYVEGLAYQEICEVLTLPIGTVKTNLHRARKELAEAMRAAGWAPAPRADDAETPRGGEP
ncbi:MAG TPA: sigma-70 family RNA polymerase sigma factor [Thermoanaerobaculia bacterium]|jgi:RNA polymerase sigma-70 factor (ECF subfamily)|nr:sigma-70 family RNA polymerase sigma factor [Thermoanaerobaculia bacterium]